MASVKTKKRNKLGDTLLDDCLVIFIERDIFFEVDKNRKHNRDFHEI